MVQISAMRVSITLLAALLALSASSLLAQAPSPSPAAPVTPPAIYKANLIFYLDARRKALPIELFRGIALFKVTLGGREAWMMLDNGADRSLIDMKLLNPLGIKSEAREGRTIRTPTGALPYRVALEVPLVIPGQLEIKMPMAAIDLSAISGALGHQVDAVLGADLLNNTVFGLDAGRGVLQLMPAAAKVNFQVQPISLAKGKPQFEVIVDGKPLQLTIDLGYSGELSVSPEAWARVGAPDAKKEARLSTHAEGQAYSIDHSSLPVVGIGGIERKNVGVDIRPIPAKDGDGWIGMGIMSQFIMVLDMTAGKLWLIPRLPSTPSAAAAVAPASTQPTAPLPSPRKSN